MAIPPQLRSIVPANVALSDRAIRRAILLDRFTDTEVAKIRAFLEREMFPDILKRAQAIGREMERLAAVRPGAIAIKARLDRLLGDVRDTIRAATVVGNGQLRDRLNELANTEAGWQRRALIEATPVELNFRAPPPALLRSIVTARPMAGKFLRDEMAELGSDTTKRVAATIRRGVAEGLGTAEIVRTLRGTNAAKFKDGVFEATRVQAERITRTAVNHTVNHARQAVFEENSDVVTGVRWVSVLDLRTSQICAALDGLEWPVGSGPRPPAHPNCRSTIVPTLPSWEELGLKNPTAATRASMTGEVPAKETFGDWLKRQPPAAQDMVLGKGKAELFRRGKVSIRQFVDVPKLRPLTLHELEALERGTQVRIVEAAGEVRKPTPKPKPPAFSFAKARGAALRTEFLKENQALLDRAAAARAELERLTEEATKAQREAMDAFRDPNRSPERNRLIERTGEASRLARAKVDFAKVAQKEASSALAKELHKALAVEDGAVFDVIPGKGTTRGSIGQAMMKRAREAVRFMRSIVSSKLAPHDVEVRKSGGRAYAHPNRGSPFVSMRSNAELRVYLHELGHTLEFSSQSVREEAVRFLRARGAKDPRGLRSLNSIWKARGFPRRGYGNAERAWEDDFIDPYMGKDYAGQWTELVSMGVETLYGEPDLLLVRDPEMFDWLVDLLRGFTP